MLLTTLNLLGLKIPMRLEVEPVLSAKWQDIGWTKPIYLQLCRVSDMWIASSISRARYCCQSSTDTCTRYWKVIEVTVAASKSATSLAWYSRVLRIRRGPSTNIWPSTNIGRKQLYISFCRDHGSIEIMNRGHMQRSVTDQRTNEITSDTESRLKLSKTQQQN